MSCNRPSHGHSLSLFPQSLSSTVTLEHDSLLPPGVHISYESQCGDSEKRLGEAADWGQCNHVRINQTVRRKGVGWGWGELSRQEGMGGQAWETM